MAAPSPTSSSESLTGSSGEPMTRRHAPVSSETPGRIRVGALTGDTLRESEGEAGLADLRSSLDDPKTTVWVDMTDPSPDQVQAVGAALKLHPLIVEDVLEGNQRAKIETTNGVIHIVLFALTHGKRFVASEIDLVLGLGFLLSVHDDGWDPNAVHHLRQGLAPIMARGPDHLLWAICDDIVDGYFPFVDDLGEAIDSIQDEIIAAPTPNSLERLFALKRELIEVRRAASPTREAFAQLTNRDLPLIDDEEIVYFRDVYDHVIRLTDELDNYRELASSTLDVYLTQINNNLSAIMKRLTGVTVILAGVGALAGIFGMSEASPAFTGEEGTGFWAISALTFALAGTAAFVLRRIGWI
jgi:magnesium transporter